MEFGSETEIRTIMTTDSKDEAQRRSGTVDNANKTKKHLEMEELKRGIADLTNKQYKMRG